MSPQARRVLRYLMENSTTVVLEDAARFLRLSKTAMRRALLELEEAGAIQIEAEE